MFKPGTATVLLLPRVDVVLEMIWAFVGVVSRVESYMWLCRVAWSQVSR